MRKRINDTTYIGKKINNEDHEKQHIIRIHYPTIGYDRYWGQIVIGVGTAELSWHQGAPALRRTEWRRVLGLGKKIG